MNTSDESLLPLELNIHQHSRTLEIVFNNGEQHVIPMELLRVYSPSAEVQGHGMGQETLQTGKREVNIISVRPVGHYGIQPEFTDGHDSGIYTWSYLRRLGLEQPALWQQYLDKLKIAGLERDASMDHFHSNSTTCSHH